MQETSIGDRILRILGVLFRVLRWVVTQVWTLASRGVAALRSSDQGTTTAAGTAAGAQGTVGSLSDRARHMATEASEKAQAVAGDVKHRAGELKEQVSAAGQGEGGIGGAVSAAGERARHMAAEAGEKGRAIAGDVRHRAEDLKQQVTSGGQATGGETGELTVTRDAETGMVDTAEFPGAERFASEYSQSVTTPGQPATESGIPTTSREQSLAGDQHDDLGGTEAHRYAAEAAAGGTITDRPGEEGITRRTGEADAAAFAYTGTEAQGVPIAESMYETTAPSAADNESTESDTASGEQVVADAIQSSTSDSDVDMASYGDTPEMTNIARDAPMDTWQRTSNEVIDPVRGTQDLDLTETPSGEPIDQGAGPWEAESASDTDMPAASRGVRFYGEESGVEGMSAETGEGFGREEEDLLTAGGEIDLENDEAPGWESDETPDIVSLDEVDEEGEVAFGGEDTSLVQDTLGLRESEDEPVQAGRNDDVSMRLATGGPEEEERDSDLSKPNEDLDTGDASTEGSEGGGENLGISGDYDKAKRTEKVPAVPEDEEAGSGGSTGSGPEGDKASSGTGGGTSARATARGNGKVPNGAVRGDGTANCPVDHPIKGNANSRIYHLPGQSSYEQTVPEYCFATEEDARAAGFRPRKA
jgi:hypothetical protein